MSTTAKIIISSTCLSILVIGNIQYYINYQITLKAAKDISIYKTKILAELDRDTSLCNPISRKIFGFDTFAEFILINNNIIDRKWYYPTSKTESCRLAIKNLWIALRSKDCEFVLTNAKYVFNRDFTDACNQLDDLLK